MSINAKPRRKYQTSYAGRYSEANLALPRDLQREFRQVRHDAKLARMMDCRKVDKFDRGEHVFTPVAKPEHISFLNPLLCSFARVRFWFLIVCPKNASSRTQMAIFSGTSVTT